MKKVSVIDDLVGVEISAIAFVRDYVEIHFDGPILRCLSNPSLVLDGVAYAFPSQGSRDALCTVIGDTVANISLNPRGRFELTTSRGRKIVVPLDVHSRRGDEAMHFVPAQNAPMDVW
jgi:hypothetical protein